MHGGKWEVVAGAKEKGKARQDKGLQRGRAPCVPCTARGPGSKTTVGGARALGDRYSSTWS